MKITKQMSRIEKLLKNKITGPDIPIAMRWNLTYRCNLDCSYCNLREKADIDEELSTERIKEGLDTLAELGVERISFSGGEPLLRDDIGEIIDYSKRVGISPTMNSNGILIPEKIEELENLELLKISLDGTKKTHNKQRGKYDETIKGIHTAIDNDIKTTLCTTFTKNNYTELEDLCQLAEDIGTVIAIQRATNLYENFDGAEELLPKSSEIEETMDKIIQIKKDKPNIIRNSIRHLNLIKNYPDHEKLRCTAGQLFFMINPDGTVLQCDRIDNKQQLPNIKDTDPKECYEQLERTDCQGCCFCGSMELNYIYHFKLDVVRDLINFLRANER